MDNIIDKVKELESKINTLKIKTYNKGFILFSKKLIDSINDSISIIENYYIEDKNNLDIDRELDLEIKNLEHVKSMMDIFLPLILYYQINNNI